MDLRSAKFGRGSKELGGAVDLLNYYKLWPIHEHFCKKTLPSSISDTQYLHNVVGDTKIRRGEGWELDQLMQNTSCVEERRVRMHPFELDTLREAFHMRETTPIGLPYAEKGIATTTLKLQGESNGNKKSKKRRQEGMEKQKDHKKRKHHDEGNSRNKDTAKSRIERCDFGPQHLERLQDKFKNPKINQRGRRVKIEH